MHGEDITQKDAEGYNTYAEFIIEVVAINITATSNR